MARRVLIIEDDPLLLDVITVKFTRNEWDVISVASGEDGLEEIGKQKPDIILLDILLPGMNGYEVLHQIKTDANLQHIPVLILSNFGEEDQIAKSKSLGAESHMIKANTILDDVISRANELVSN